MKTMDTEAVIKEWLADCKQTSQDELTTFAKGLVEKEETAKAIFRVLEDRIKYADVI
jgi:hypothetical protein